MDHDQRLKLLIKLFFAEFMQLFFAEWAARFDFSSVEWLDKEVFSNPPEGKRHVLDLVAKITTREPIPEMDIDAPLRMLALIHIEIESPDRSTSIKSRFPDYYLDLTREYGLPVLPIALFLKVGLDGIGVDSAVRSFIGFETLRFQYLYVGLPALDGLEYLEMENWLAVALASLMRIPKDRIAWLGAEALRKISQSGLTDQEKFLLGDCVEAYLPLDEESRAVFEELYLGSPKQGEKPVNKTSYDKGLEVGKKEGLEVGKKEGIEQARIASLTEYRNTLLRALNERFESIPQSLIDHIYAANWDRVTELLIRAMKISRVEELLAE